MSVPIKTDFFLGQFLNLFAFFSETDGYLPDLFDFTGVEAPIYIFRFSNTDMESLSATVMSKVKTVHHLLLAHPHTLLELVRMCNALHSKPSPHQQ
jgi:hypothetical protein